MVYPVTDCFVFKTFLCISLRMNNETDRLRASSNGFPTNNARIEKPSTPEGKVIATPSL